MNLCTDFFVIWRSVPVVSASMNSRSTALLIRHTALSLSFRSHAGFVYVKCH